MGKAGSKFTLVLALAAASAAVWAQTPVAPAAPAAPDRQDMRSKITARFSAADVDHDGKLTREEAAKMPMVARNFDQIDKTKKGYVTLEDLQAFARERAAARQAAKAVPAT